MLRSGPSQRVEQGLNTGEIELEAPPHPIRHVFGVSFDHNPARADFSQLDFEILFPHFKHFNPLA